MADEPEREREPLHELKNQLTVIVGFADLLIENLPESDPRHADLLEIRQAAEAALSIVPKLR